MGFHSVINAAFMALMDALLTDMGKDGLGYVSLHSADSHSHLKKR